MLKVILESAALDADRAGGWRPGLRREAGADYLKTSTGFHPAGGATVEAVATLARLAAEAGPGPTGERSGSRPRAASATPPPHWP